MPDEKNNLAPVHIGENAKREKTGRLSSKNINHHNYTVTLLDEALRVGLITDEDADDIRVSITDALEKSVMTFTGGDSSSVMSETANSLLHSVLFAVDAYLLSLKNDYRAVDELKSTAIPRLYDLGMKKLKLLIYETMSLLVKCRNGRIDIPNRRYNETIDKQITGFLKTYNIATNAHISSSFAYKTSLSLNHLNGIYKIKTAAYYLCCENSFCSAYDDNEIKALYKRWCDQNIVSYADADVNIYELVFISAVFCDYLKKEHGSLSLTRDDCELICRLLEDFDEYKIADILDTTASRLIYGDREYNSRALALMTPRLIRAIQNNTLESIIPIDTGN